MPNRLRRNSESFLFVRLLVFAANDHRLALGTLILIVLGNLAASGQSLDWLRHYGSLERDVGTGIAIGPAGGIFVSGYTEDVAATDLGETDAVLSKYDTNGQHEWTRQFGTVLGDQARGVVTDAVGDIYVSGYTNYTTLGGGNMDPFVSKYDAAGALQWTRILEIGNLDAGYDRSNGIATDGADGIYIAGEFGQENFSGNTDVFLRKYDTDGNLQWTRYQATSEFDSSRGIAADGLGNVFISGKTSGSIGGVNQGGRDAFLSKYGSDGALQWSRQFGSTMGDAASSVAVDGIGSVYISGFTNGSLDGANMGQADAFLRKYESDGTLAWSRQFGSAERDWALFASADDAGVVVSGFTAGDLDGTNAGRNDVFLPRFDTSGNRLWTRQFGSSGLDEALGVTSHLGSVYFAGVWEQPNTGQDVFVAKLSEDLAGCDFDGNNLCNIEDLNTLLLLGPVATGVVAAGQERFDLTGDGIIDNADVDQWLASGSHRERLGLTLFPWRCQPRWLRRGQ